MFSSSVVLWVAGAALGAVVIKEHRVLGAIGGAIVVGGVGDALLERGYRIAAEEILAQKKLEGARLAVATSPDAAVANAG
jgi:hypothetical protein